MAQVQTTSGPTLVQEGPIKTFLRATEIDTRMLGMIGALLIIWLGFHLYGYFVNGFGAFLTARNLWNLSVQTSSITVMATGMVLIIVTRNIDLSVGSMLGVTAMLTGALQVWWLPTVLGIGHPAIWIVTVLFGNPLLFGTGIIRMSDFGPRSVSPTAKTWCRGVYVPDSRHARLGAQFPAPA